MTVTEQAQTSISTSPSSTDAASSPDKGRIVVGVDGSAGSLAALGWAVEEARLRASSLYVVMTWQMPQTYGSPGISGMGVDPSLDAKTVLAEAAADEASRLAQAVVANDVPTTWNVAQGHPAWKLIEISDGADLLVVGSRGHGGFVGAMLGSVSQHVVTHAHCPVVVIPDPRRAVHAAAQLEAEPLAYTDGVFDQGHQHREGEPGQGVYEQGHAEPVGQGVYEQGQAESGEGVFDQGRPVAEDV